MSFKFIRDHADRWPIRLMCRVLEVSARGLSGIPCAGGHSGKEGDPACPDANHP